MINRRLAAAAVVSAGLTVLAGCGSTQVALDLQPSGAKEGKALARAVAAQADCDGFETLDAKSADHWIFSCQTAEHSFAIVTTAESSVTQTQLDKLTENGSPAKSGPHFVVVESQRSDSKATPTASQNSALSAFPGTLVTKDRPK